MRLFTRRSAVCGALLGSFSSVTAESSLSAGNADPPDTSYAPQFRAGSGTQDVVEFVYSLSCPDCANFYRSKLRNLLRRIARGQASTVVFHNLVISTYDLELSTEVLLSERYPEFCLSILEHNADSRKIISLEQVFRLRDARRYGRRKDADRSRARFSLGLLNKYARENLSIHETPAIFRNKARVSSI
jgi:hypothetical protein